jgi:hypothetical protein
MWVVIAATGIAAALAVTFWQKILAWANNHLARWLGAIFGAEAREAFRLLLTAVDRLAVGAQRAFAVLEDRILRAELFFRRITGGAGYEKALRVRMKKADGEVVTLDAAEVVPWHELPDDVREKFIRRQTADVTLELKLKG